MYLPAPYLRKTVAYARIDEEGREIYLIKYTNDVSLQELKQNPRKTVALEEVNTVWGKRTMYVARQKDHD